MEKTAKIVYDSQSYWLLWHWQELLSGTPLKHAARYVGGPFETLEEVNQAAEEARKHDWYIESFGL